MTQRLWVPGPLPGLNELLTAKGCGFGKRNGYNRLKQSLTTAIIAQVRAQGLQRIDSAVFLRFRWYEASRRRDPDNVAGGGRKIVLDALVKAGILEDDGWAEISGWEDSFVLCRERPGVDVELSPG